MQVPYSSPGCRCPAPCSLSKAVLKPLGHVCGWCGQGRLQKGSVCASPWRCCPDTTFLHLLPTPRKCHPGLWQWDLPERSCGPIHPAHHTDVQAGAKCQQGCGNPQREHLRAPPAHQGRRGLTCSQEMLGCVFTSSMPFSPRLPLPSVSFQLRADIQPPLHLLELLIHPLLHALTYSFPPSSTGLNLLSCLWPPLFSFMGATVKQFV